MTTFQDQCSGDSYVPSGGRKKHRAYIKWTPQENKLYVCFLIAHKQIFQDEYNRRVNKVFKKLAEFIKTRDQEQCKSHHQKMLKAYNTLNNLIDALQQSVRSKYKEQSSPVKVDKKTEWEQSAEMCDSIFNELNKICSVEQALFDVLSL